MFVGPESTPVVPPPPASDVARVQPEGVLIVAVSGLVDATMRQTSPRLRMGGAAGVTEVDPVPAPVVVGVVPCERSEIVTGHLPFSVAASSQAAVSTASPKVNPSLLIAALFAADEAEPDDEGEIAADAEAPEEEGLSPDDETKGARGTRSSPSLRHRARHFPIETVGKPGVSVPGPESPMRLALLLVLTAAPATTRHHDDDDGDDPARHQPPRPEIGRAHV